MRTRRAITPGTMSVQRTPMSPATTCSRVAAALSATSGVARWARRRPIRTGPARRAGFHAALDDSRYDARRPRDRLVSETRIRHRFVGHTHAILFSNAEVAKDDVQQFIYTHRPDDAP